MSARRLSFNGVQRVLDYGRVVHARGSTIYAVGKKEVTRLRAAGIDLTTEEGVQVVCSNSGTVMTAYRNHDLRGLRPRRRRRRQRRW